MSASRDQDETNGEFAACPIVGVLTMYPFAKSCLSSMLPDEAHIDRHMNCPIY